MKKWMAFLLALVCLLSLCACNSEKNAETSPYVTVYLISEKAYENGYTHSFTYDTYGNQIAEVYHYNGRESTLSTRTYDENNHILEEVFYNYGKEYRRDTYTYDEKGNLTEYIMFLAATTDLDGCLAHGDLIDRDTYTYDQDGNLIEKIHYDNGKERRKSTYIYDRQNNRRFTYMYSMYETGYGPPGTQIEILDDAGRVIRSEYYDSDDHDRLDEAEPHLVYTYTYEGENLMEEVYYFQGEVKYHTTFEYNTQGDVTKRTHFQYSDLYDTTCSEKTYEYAYDAAGNITQYKVYSNGKLVPSSSYTCTYIQVQMTRAQARKLGYI